MHKPSDYTIAYVSRKGKPQGITRRRKLIREYRMYRAGKLIGIAPTLEEAQAALPMVAEWRYSSVKNHMVGVD